MSWTGHVCRLEHSQPQAHPMHAPWVQVVQAMCGGMSMELTGQASAKLKGGWVSYLNPGGEGCVVHASQQASLEASHSMLHRATSRGSSIIAASRLDMSSCTILSDREEGAAGTGPEAPCSHSSSPEAPCPVLTREGGGELSPAFISTGLLVQGSCKLVSACIMPRACAHLAPRISSPGHFMDSRASAQHRLVALVRPLQFMRRHQQKG